MNRKIQYYKNYFIDFYNSLDIPAQRKYVKSYTRLVKTRSRGVTYGKPVIIL